MKYKDIIDDLNYEYNELSKDVRVYEVMCSKPKDVAEIEYATMKISEISKMQDSIRNRINFIIQNDELPIVKNGVIINDFR